MEKLSPSIAAELVKAALAANAIKLTGASSHVEGSKKTGEADAVYLLTLMHHLTNQSSS